MAALPLRGWVRLTHLVALLLFYLVLHGLWRLVRRASPWPPRFLGAAARAVGVDWSVEGRPLSRDVLLISNHLSWLDILVIAGATGARFVAKDEVRHWPGIGWLAGLNRTVFVARAARGRVQDQAEQLRAALVEGLPVTLFPEGGTGNGQALAPFRASLIAALWPPLPALRAQPIVLDYGAEAPLIAWPEADGAGTEALRILGLPGRRRVVLRCLAPIDPATLADRKALTHAAREAMRAALGESPAEPV